MVLFLLTLMLILAETVMAQHGHADGSKKKRILMVAANPSISTQTGWPIGCWAAEITHPHYTFTEAGYEVDIASPRGGRVEFDAYSDPRDASGYSAHDLISLGFIHSPHLMKKLDSTKSLSQVRVEQYDALFVCGGQSPMYTFINDTNLHRFFVRFYETGKPTAAICHGTCLLLKARTSSGALLVEGKTWTGFADAEEDYADRAVGKKIQPFRIQTEAVKIPNTNFIAQGPFRPFAIRDGNLITGQQQNSGIEAARLVIEMLGR
jgi:putative intracellular protease/amidase